MSLKPKKRVPEVLVEAKLIFGIWVLIFWGQKYQILSKSGQKMPKIFSKPLQKHMKNQKPSKDHIGKSYKNHTKSYENHVKAYKTV